MFGNTSYYAASSMRLLRAHTDKQSFIYVDTHCSLGHFPLPENGQWIQGIGLFYGKWPLADQPYFVMEQKAYERDRSYLGSWKLVAPRLRLDAR